MGINAAVNPDQARRPLGACDHSPGGRQGCWVRGVACASWLTIALTPVIARKQPVIWRDPDTEGGLAPRPVRDGAPDCPEAHAGARLVAETARGIARGLVTRHWEMEHLRERFNAAAPPEERL